MQHLQIAVALLCISVRAFFPGPQAALLATPKRGEKGRDSRLLRDGPRLETSRNKPLRGGSGNLCDPITKESFTHTRELRQTPISLSVTENANPIGPWSAVLYQTSPARVAKRAPANATRRKRSFSLACLCPALVLQIGIAWP